MSAVIETPLRLAITRSFDAPPERLFDAWLNGSWARWLGSNGVECLESVIDPRVGGAWRYRGRTPDGREFEATGVYKEIVRPSRLVFSWNGCLPGAEDTTVTLTFRPKGVGTEMTLVHEGFRGAEPAARHDQGWGASFDRLAAMLAA